MSPGLIDTTYETSVGIRTKTMLEDENHAFVLRQKGQFTYETRPIPTLPSDRHVIVEIKATGLCGSDVHYWQHGEIGQFKVRKPIILGHESAGVVWKCGDAVRSLQPGCAVAIEPGIPCRLCSYCKKGKYNLCPDVEFAATPPHDGTLQTFVAVPEDFCYKLSKNVTLEEGALLEPLSVAVHCAKLAKVSFGASVLVMGAGPIGVLCCATARAFGATKLTAVDVATPRLEFVREYANALTYETQRSLSSEANAARILATQGDSFGGFDVVIEATGVEQCISTGIHALRRGGIFVQAGLGAPDVSFPIGQLCSKEALFTGSFRYGPGDYDTAVNLIEEGIVKLQPLITHRFSFDEAEKAFQNVVLRQGIKTIISGSCC